MDEKQPYFSAGNMVDIFILQTNTLKFSFGKLWLEFCHFSSLMPQFAREKGDVFFQVRYILTTILKKQLWALLCSDLVWDHSHKKSNFFFICHCNKYSVRKIHASINFRAMLYCTFFVFCMKKNGEKRKTRPSPLVTVL